jgi:hypothetical protein
MNGLSLILRLLQVSVRPAGRTGQIANRPHLPLRQGAAAASPNLRELVSAIPVLGAKRLWAGIQLKTACDPSLPWQNRNFVMREFC